MFLRASIIIILMMPFSHCPGPSMPGMPRMPGMLADANFQSSAIQISIVAEKLFLEFSRKTEK
jgi:hypothetical protein